MIELKWNREGLIPAVIQDAQSGEVLMVAYMNKQALETTIETRKVCFYSRSRKKLWVKGETSGHTQEVVEILTDCDRDTVLVRVKQTGGACHLGYRSCFVHRFDPAGEHLSVTQKRLFEPEDIYKKT